jgi:hypothetical protein
MPATSENGQYLATGSPILASAFVSGPGVNGFKALPSSPGRSVQFRAGMAVIRDERDLIACLRDVTVQVVVERDYVDWIAKAMNECGTVHPPQGELTLPAGFYVVLNAGEWELRMEGAEPEQREPAAVIELPDMDPDAAPLPEGVQPGAWLPPRGKRK